MYQQDTAATATTYRNYACLNLVKLKPRMPVFGSCKGHTHRTKEGAFDAAINQISRDNTSTKNTSLVINARDP